MGLDALPVHGEGDVAEGLAGEELVEGLGQLLRVVNPREAKVLATVRFHDGLTGLNFFFLRIFFSCFDDCLMALVFFSRDGCTSEIG